MFRLASLNSQRRCRPRSRGRFFVPRLVCTLALALLAAGSAAAIDGVIEINATRARAGGVTAGDAPGYPVTISERGSYRLTGVLAVQDQTAIEVTASGVSIDLNGHGIECATTCTSGFGIRSTAPSIRIRDGFVRGMGESGITTSSRVRISNVDVSNNGTGLSASSGCIGQNLRARGNANFGLICSTILVESVAHENGANGLYVVNGVAAHNLATGNGTPGGASLDNNGLRIAGGVARANTLRGNAHHGIRSQQATLLRGNTSAGNTFYGAFNEGFGDVGYVGNVFDDNATGTVHCVIGSACVEIGGNLCDGSSTCP